MVYHYETHLEVDLDIHAIAASIEDAEAEVRKKVQRIKSCCNEQGDIIHFGGYTE